MHGHFPNAYGIAYNVIVRLFTPGTTTEIQKVAAPTDTNGYFTIANIIPGTYDVGIKTDACLSEKAANQVFVAGETTEVTFSNWRGGDLNQNDAVTATDYSILSRNFNKLGAYQGAPGNWLMP